MIHQQEYVKTLLQKRMDRTLSPAEEKLLAMAYVIYSEEEIFEMLDEMEGNEKYPAEVTRTSRNMNRYIPWIVKYVAVVLIVFTVFALIYHFRGPRTLELICHSQPKQMVTPGRNKMMLDLDDDGYGIMIDTTHVGLVLDHPLVNVSRLRTGELVYTPKRRDLLTPVYNTLISSSGSRKTVLLPDGSRMLMIGACKVRFPLVLRDGVRRLEVEGNVYFEVAPIARSHFYVNTKSGVEIEAKGTRFNVNTSKGKTVATLLSGKICIATQWDSAVLTPGEQAMVPDKDAKNENANIQVQKTGPGSISSVSGNLRIYKHIPLAVFLKEIEFQYNVEMVNLENIPNHNYTGTLSTDTPLSEVLEILKVDRITYRMEGNRIIFSP